MIVPAEFARLRDIVADELFAAAAPSDAPRIGAELELLPVEVATGRRAPPDGGRAATLPVLRVLAAADGWAEELSAKSVPTFRLPGGGAVTHEPGGQLEYAAPPMHGTSALARDLTAVHDRLAAECSTRGIALVARGIDAAIPAAAAALEVDAARYRLMDDYLGEIGPAGRRMMRQTASLQICLDTGPGAEGLEQWRLLNAAAPALTAMFANSPVYDGRATGHASHRAWTWRVLDPRRTGIAAAAASPADQYTAFALRAPALLEGRWDGIYRPFGFWWRRGRADYAAWREHLTTLFPEVRPRRYLELRSLDTPPAVWLGAPLALVTGLAYEPRVRAAALELLGAPDGTLLGAAATAGMRDPRLGPMAAALATLALRGAAALGRDWVGGAELDAAREYVRRFVTGGETLARCDAGDAALRAARGVRLAA